MPSVNTVFQYVLKELENLICLPPSMDDVPMCMNVKRGQKCSTSKRNRLPNAALSAAERSASVCTLIHQLSNLSLVRFILSIQLQFSLSKCISSDTVQLQHDLAGLCNAHPSSIYLVKVIRHVVNVWSIDKLYMVHCPCKDQYQYSYQ